VSVLRKLGQPEEETNLVSFDNDRLVALGDGRVLDFGGDHDVLTVFERWGSGVKEGRRGRKARKGDIES
jgi:hypothetical protein